MLSQLGVHLTFFDNVFEDRKGYVNAIDAFTHLAPRLTMLLDCTSTTDCFANCHSSLLYFAINLIPVEQWATSKIMRTGTKHNSDIEMGPYRSKLLVLRQAPDSWGVESKYTPAPLLVTYWKYSYLYRAFMSCYFCRFIEFCLFGENKYTTRNLVNISIRQWMLEYNLDVYKKIKVSKELVTVK